MNKSAVFFVQLFSKRFSRLRSKSRFFYGKGTNFETTRAHEGRKGEEASLSRVPLARVLKTNQKN